MAETTIPRLKALYDENVKSSVMEKHGLKNPMQAPKLQKITVNMGLGNTYRENKRLFEVHEEELGMITGQKPVRCHAKRSAATFKLREGDLIGLKVTLRGPRMWHFLEKLINVACPRIRDFNGLKHGFDRRGNYTVGFKDQAIFPEIKVDKVQRQQGMDVCFTISGESDALSKDMLLGLGFPLAHDAGKKKNDE